MPLALAGGFFTTEPPGKPEMHDLLRLQYLEWEESMGHPCGHFQPVLGKIRLTLGQVT